MCLLYSLSPSESPYCTTYMFAKQNSLSCSDKQMHPCMWCICNWFILQQALLFPLLTAFESEWIKLAGLSALWNLVCVCVFVCGFSIKEATIAWWREDGVIRWPWRARWNSSSSKCVTLSLFVCDVSSWWNLHFLQDWTLIYCSRSHQTRRRMHVLIQSNQLFTRSGRHCQSKIHLLNMFYHLLTHIHSRSHTLNRGGQAC